MNTLHFPETAKIRSFTDLLAWKEGHKLVLEVYRMTAQFPQAEIFGLTNQMRRAAVSITSNIAEGFSKRTRKEKIQFYSTAVASLTELQNQSLIARDVTYMSDADFQSIAKQTVLVSKLLHGLIKGAMTHS